MTIAEEYASYCATAEYDDIPTSVVEQAKKLLLDTTGIAVGSVTRATSSETFLQGVRRLDTGGTGGTVLATGEQRSPAYAALLNGALAHSLDFDDTHRSASLHPGAPVVPAALVAAEQTNATGKELLTGIVVGYEVACRLGMAVDPAAHYAKGFHMTSTCGVFGATAAAGSVFGLDESELTAAFGINGSQAAGSLQFLDNGAWNKRAHPGFAAHSGVVAVTLAMEGFVGATAPIEGDRGFFNGYTDSPYPEKATADLGEVYELANTGIKPYPCCRYMHAPLDLLLDIVGTNDISSDDVEEVTVQLAEEGVKITGEPTNVYPKSFVDAQFNMAFGAALALDRKTVTVDAFLDEVEKGVRPELRRLIDVTTVGSAEWIEDLYPDRWAAEVTIDTDDGTYTQTGEYARGEPENPLSWKEVVQKYESLTEDVIGPETATDVRECIAELETHTTAELMTEFTSHGRPPGLSETTESSTEGR